MEMDKDMETRNHLTEEGLDALIRQSFERKKIAEDISVSVMKELRRATRRRRLYQWARMVAFSFGLPMVMLVFGWLLWSFVSRESLQLQFTLFDSQISLGNWVYLCLVFPVATMIYAFFRAIEKFSWQQV